MAKQVDVFLLGGFRAVVDGVDVPPDGWSQRRARDLVKLLALAPRRRMHREQVIDALWPELSSAAGGANLRKAVHFARRALGWEEAIAIVDGMVELAPDASVTVDCETFEREALSAQRSCDIGQFVKAAELYTGDVLPEDLYEPWAEEARANVRRKYVQVLRAGAQWERLVEVDPFDEAAHRSLIRQHLVAGDRASALHCYERLTKILDEELGIVPDGESQALYREALAQADDAPPTAEQRASVLLGSALLCTHRGALDQAEREASQARQLAAQAGLGRQLGEASALLGMVAHMPRPLARAVPRRVPRHGAAPPEHGVLRLRRPPLPRRGVGLRGRRRGRWPGIRVRAVCHRPGVRLGARARARQPGAG